MEYKRLNLDDFKVKADSMETASVLEKISGGATSDCHCEEYWIDNTCYWCCTTDDGGWDCSTSFFGFGNC